MNDKPDTVSTTLTNTESSISEIKNLLATTPTEKNPEIKPNIEKPPTISMVHPENILNLLNNPTEAEQKKITHESEPQKIEQTIPSTQTQQDQPFTSISTLMNHPAQADIPHVPEALTNINNLMNPVHPAPEPAPVKRNENTEKTGHRKVEKIVGMKIYNGKRYFLVKYAGEKQHVVVDGAIIRKHNQKVLLNFYEEHLKLVDVNPEEPQVHLTNQILK
ncbi:hypothetical protein TVAG_173980 [Trichomonas vaginalis G3]|uniref:Chromo shadow domain-containing protein n=1 Tax=Trichomonas vaginalis (strain ATCC PRA-98 / G3) TaxID=412133 RepID=A2EWU1_TRIV3|nr:hypothetical protein TVAGG3_0813380 [Trichomonas vaginalis G3]EAY02856.1 hypothetical protein TVAG_173980 [Trichomonas vaginalis G3]KAI5497370.1 hypothetical protein TVAGG3_0813380 [Trichomonas vaginalis G3]|eukprot:XP_001315079.1 hypothetical protein [Trichomonas vaginalis G3]